MGLSPSKAVDETLKTSPEFVAACNSVYEECLNLTQHVFSGVRRYQLSDAAARLHVSLSATLPLIKRWVSSPPSQSQVDSALRNVCTDEAHETLTPAEFKAFAVEVFKDAIISNAGKAILLRVPIGIAGIGGIGMVTQCGREVVGKVMGAYALGVVGAVYLSLSG